MRLSDTCKYLSVALCIAVADIVDTAHAEGFDLCGLHYSEIPELQSNISILFPQRPQETDRFISYFDRQTDTWWSFARTGHQPYPAVVCRKVVQDGAKITIKMEVNCFGTTPQCDGMVADFKKLDDEMVARTKGSTQ